MKLGVLLCLKLHITNVEVAYKMSRRYLSLILSNRQKGTEKFAKIRHYAVALEICLRMGEILV
jgi:hypothetical protein